MVSRREWLLGLLAGPLISEAAAQSGAHAAAAGAPSARTNFQITGTYLNAAYTHPLPLDAAAAVQEYLLGREDPGVRRRGSANDAKALFARLINASVDEVAGIPSTSYGESFVIGALGLKAPTKAKVVTDILHFDGSLYTYGQLEKRGLGLTILPMTEDGRIDMNRLESAVDRDTRLVAISLVSMVNGFEHDLKTVCDIAHRKGAYVYVDAVQAAGAVPVDVKASGVDFLACSSFKWLMGDFGFGFLYVRADLLPRLSRPEFGYHQPANLAYHAFPGDPPGDTLFEASPENTAARGYFEVGSLGTAAEIAVGVSLKNLLATGVDQIQRTRQPLMDRLYEQLSTRYRPLTPKGSRSSIISFVLPRANEILRPRITEASINIQLYRNRFRISPSIYNTPGDVDRVIGVLMT